MHASLGLRLSLFALAVALAVVGGSFMWNMRTEATGTPQPKLKTVSIPFDSKTIRVEVAETDEERRQGLSFRESLGWNEGMLFTYPVVGRQTMWMYGMKFPIDVVFINGNVVVDYEERVPPPQKTFGRISEVSTANDIDMVLELPAGKAADLQIGIGTRISIRR
jgi:uncharacterized membrane protein (UPF0127 family)